MNRRAPPWWPEGESWPPRGRPGWWGSEAKRRFRRRFVAWAAVVLGLVVAIGVLLGLAIGHAGPWWRSGLGPGPGAATGSGRRSGAGALFAFAAVVTLVAGVATVRAYRRVSRPVGALLGAAGRLAGGDYTVSVDVDPSAPRELRGLTATFNDLAARLASADEQRRRFLADVTHELRTPLAVLQAGIEAQIDGVHPRDDRHLASLLEETQQLGRLVEDLHTLALTGAGRLVLHRERVAPSALVDDAVDAHAAPASRKGVALTATVAAGLPDLDVDRTRMRQVLANLLANAVRATPGGGWVRVEVAATGPGPGAAGQGAAGARFSVADSGPGLPADRLTRPFDRDAGGLGLAIAHDLVTVHGGTIEAANGAAGGAVVSFTLPAST